MKGVVWIKFTKPDFKLDITKVLQKYWERVGNSVLVGCCLANRFGLVGVRWGLAWGI